MNGNSTAPAQPASGPQPGDVPLEDALAAAIIRHCDDAIVAKTLEGRVLSWNAGAEKVFGYRAEEMIGKPITRLFPADLLHEEEMLIAQIRAGQVVDHFETRRIRKDGSCIHVSVTLSPIRDRAGHIVAVSKIARDMTAQRRQREAESLAAALVEHSHDGIIVMDPDGIIKGWNRAAERIYGYGANEMLGSSPVRLTPSHLQPQAETLLARVRRGHGVLNVMTQRLRRDGAILEVSLTFSPVFDHRDELVAVAKTVRDYTERTQLLDRLRRVSEDLTQVLVAEAAD